MLRVADDVVELALPTVETVRAIRSPFLYDATVSETVRLPDAIV
jgi:hypothetical protein